MSKVECWYHYFFDRQAFNNSAAYLFLPHIGSILTSSGFQAGCYPPRILASGGAKIEQLIKTFQVTRKTIYNWFERWESEGILGLYNKPGRGRQATFDSVQEYQIREWTKQEPKQLKHVVQKIKETWGIKISTKTIKRILKKFNMSWHRMRLEVGGEPDPSEYQEKKTQLAEFKQLEERGELDLYYLDETGFCLIPCVPYGWQERGKYLKIKSRRSRRINVLGIMNRKNNLETYVSLQSINSDVIVACIDAFFPIVNKPTVIVVYRASIHTSGYILDKIEEWKERGITIFELPTYSPELNLIEILWRFIKYEWIDIDAYSSWEFLLHLWKKSSENLVINM